MTLEFKLPELGENIESGDVIEVLVAVGDSVTEGQTVLEIEAGKASMEIPSPAEGVIRAVHVVQGDSVAVGQLVFTLDTEGKSELPEPRAAPEPEATPESEPEVEIISEPEQQAVEESAELTVEEDKPSKAVSAAPNVRRLARELGVDVHAVLPGEGGERISIDDVKGFAKKTLENGRSEKGHVGDQSVRVEKMLAVRKVTMKHMSHCWATVPHVTQHDTADITRLNQLRKQFGIKAEAVGVKLTLTAILIKVVSTALKVFPLFNSSIDAEAQEIIYKNFFNIGIAVDTSKGLMVPVIRDADRKNMIELAQDLGGIAIKAREGNIRTADLQGGTFTITNLGGIGGTFFTPIVNSPEVAILGVGRAFEEVDKNGDVKLKMPLSLSYDHRIIDGADGARFLRWIIEAIEEPFLLSLEG